MITFKEAFDRLTRAYIHGEVNAYDSRFCFCGNLENNNIGWVRCNIEGLNYSRGEYLEMERVFMHPIRMHLSGYRINPYHSGGYRDVIKSYNEGKIALPGYEEALWRGFNDALEVLRQIHISRGEEVEEIVLPKREKTLV